MIVAMAVEPAQCKRGESDDDGEIRTTRPRSLAFVAVTPIGADAARPHSMITPAALGIEGVSKRFGDIEVVKSVSIDVAPGTILSLLGPSGCGKTTILRMIAGLLRPSSGRIRIAGEDVTGVPPHRRKLGMVFQNYSLFPHMNVTDNVAFGLKMQGTSREASRGTVGQALAMVRMGGMERRFPSELSGGQQQRVALARALVTRPRLLLLDEPFGALDRNLREEMQIEVKQLQRELEITFVFVTHDQEEALTLSDRIAVMRAGEIQQFGTPSEIFEAPATQFVAEFFGKLNTLAVRVLGGDGPTSLIEAAGRKLFVASRPIPEPKALLAVRVSDVSMSMAPADNAKSIPGILEDSIYKGNSVLCRVKLADGTTFTATSTRAALAALPGTTVHLSWQPDKALLFPLPHESEPEAAPAEGNEER
jgi:spermidine/putrescine ABC transporter ATP-binding subunit